MTEKTSRGVNPRVLKDINVSLIQSCIYKKGPLNRTDISTETNSSIATVSRVVDSLLKKNIVNTVGIIESSGAGRKAVLIGFNYDYGSVIGLNIQERHIEIALCDLKGRIIQKNKIPLVNDKSGFLKSIYELIDGVMRNKGASKLLNISVACPGVVDFKSGKIEQSIDIPILKELNLKEKLESYCKVPVCIDNDVNIAAIGEYSYYKNKNIHNLAYIEFGPGIGAGVIIDGEIYRGYMSGAGELAYCLLDEADLYKYRIDKGSLGAGINDLLMRGMPEKALNKIAMAICNYSCIMNPQLIVLDGEIVNAWREVLLKKVSKALEMSYPLVPEIRTARSGMSSKLAGAIEIALNNAAQMLNLHGVHFDIS